ncbi:MAG: response regulator [Desulfovibrio sp.]|jgi:signal transduction histidine kinase/DNA-binding response OmpR family regulator|nr:response regulator [Desulfovibrio sp.]
MDELYEQQIASLQKENTKLARQVARLQATLDRNKAVASSLSNVQHMQEMEWKKQRQYLQLLLDNSPDIIVMLDKDGRFAYCSNTFLKAMRIEYFNTINGKLFSEVCSAHDHASWASSMIEQLRGTLEENLSFTFEETITWRDNIPREYTACLTPMREENGLTNSALLLLHDITEIRDAQKSAEFAREEAERASRAKSDFLSNMSHEIRTPLNAVIGMTSLAKSSAGLEQKHYYLRKIEAASKHLLNIINDILDMSKIEANKLELSIAPFSFEKMLKKVVNVITFQVEEKCIDFRIFLDQNIPDALNGDDQRLAQIIANLLSNAVKFTPESGSVRLQTHLERERNGVCTIRIEVIDSGIGMTEQQQTRLFSPFQQADNSTSRKFGGTGLGLAISKRLVEMMYGSISARSEIDKGTTFTCTVCLERCAKEEKKPELPFPVPDPGSVRICTVSGSLTLIEYFRDILRKYDLKQDEITDSDRILERISQKAPYALCFLDWRTIAADGVNLVRRIQEQSDLGAPVIIATMREWNLIADSLNALGVKHFLPRPLFPSNVLACLEKCLGKKKVKEDSAQSSPQDDFSGYRIILAEDVEVNQEIVLACLEPTRLAIDCAGNGIEAVNLFSAAPESYDMIFMDIQMPVMDGYTATRHIRALAAPNAKTIPIVAMTANVFREDVQRCLDVGMQDHIGKPVDFNIILEKLRQYLPGRE